MNITAWAIEVTDNKGNVFKIADMPDSVSQVVDGWLSSLKGDEE